MLTHPRRGLAALVAALAVLSAAACSSSGQPAPTSGPGTSGTVTSSPSVAAGQFPVTVHAGNGNVTVPRKPTAIVSLSPTATEMLFAIGAGPQVKAVDKDSDYPPTVPRTNLNSLQLNAEAVVSYQPDLVVASGLAPAQSQQLAKLHIQVLDEPAATDITQTYQQLTQLGDVTGHADGAAAQIASMRQQIATITKAAPKQAATYYYELDQTLLHGDVDDVHRTRPPSARPHQHRGLREGRGGERWIPAAVRRVHRQGRSELRLPGRHAMLQAVAGHVGETSGLVGSGGGAR